MTPTSPFPTCSPPHLQVIVTEWLDGISLAEIIRSGTAEQRDRFGTLYLRFLLSGPARAGMLHADPHPGNFRALADGRLGVLDFGAVARLPDGLPVAMGQLLRIAETGDAEAVRLGLIDEGFIRPGIEIDPEQLLGYLAPFVEPHAIRSSITRAAGCAASTCGSTIRGIPTSPSA